LRALRVGNLVFAAGALATDFRTGVAPEARIDPAFPYYGSAIKRETRYILDNLVKIVASVLQEKEIFRQRAECRKDNVGAEQYRLACSVHRCGAVRAKDAGGKRQRSKAWRCAANCRLRLD
jgi:hypothetical protein